ncbi:hypothetical protein SeMB42_g03924 [Synchytrium endobioticum]|uniref:Uncharacterized protein n=1 Tax=Synchytrium endobioticum TaxID=286115 RepID=A0A507CWW0_9FUNG|nr:hypothetical protein SeLEV6574_g04949 [Synchytrium endobioticum]TPX45648.1 hypothetical protein SeMB42_g03924 [Synchytrium endobioticum]
MVYVIAQAVRDAAASLSTAVYNAAQSSTDLIYSVEDVHREFGRDLSLSDVMLVCRQLKMDVKLILDMTSSPETSIVKFKPTRGELTPISETDKGILTIKTTLQHLNSQVSQLEDRSSQLLQQTKTFIRNKERIRAKFSLRQHKIVSDILAKRLQSLETVEAILHKLQSAETDAELLSVYEIGTTTLRDFVSEKGLTVEKVDKTMDALDDALADQREVEAAMNLGNQQIASTSGVATISDEDLEAELDSLIAVPAPEPSVDVAGVMVGDVSTSEAVKLSVVENEDELLRELEALRVPDNAKRRTSDEIEVGIESVPG